MTKSNIKRITPSQKFNNLNKNISSLNSTYLGFVQSNNDSEMKMGRLTVWIPSINKDKTLGTFTVSYGSPFAGASQLTNSGQTSYGFWATPGVGDQVIVLFIDGDPNKGVWICCMYQQYMNNMVPGIPNASLEDGTTGPAEEYNKKGKYATNASPLRPTYSPLSEGLATQGLSGDPIRGTSTSSARRNAEPDVVGLLTPGGNQFVMDDNPDEQFVRLRTKSGTQLLVNENTGVVYAITKNGNSWMELSDDGIDFYTSKLMSFRAQKDMNFHCDGNINMFSVNNINLMSTFGTSISAGTNLNVLSGAQMNFQSGGKLSMTSSGDLMMYGGGNVGLDSGSNLALRGCSEIGITACDTIAFKSEKIMQNSSTPVTPGDPTPATVATITATGDRELSPSGGYPAIKTNTIVSRLPTHEPFDGHPTSSTAASDTGINNNVSGRVPTTVDGSNTPSAQSNDVKSGSQATDTSQAQTSNTTSSDWWIPLTGIVSSPFHDTTSAVHAKGHDGVDIAAAGNSLIMSTRSGTVTFAGTGTHGVQLYGYGTCVMVDHGDGYKSLYAHMSNTAVNSGDKVTQGQTLGYVGSSGHSTGNHCHFEIRNGTSKVNPSTFMPALGIKLKTVYAGKQKL